MDYEPDEDELKRLACGGTPARLARWRRIYRDWQAGIPFAQTAQEYGLHPSTIRRLLKYYIARQIRRKEMPWPTDSLGRKICDIPHPMPYYGRGRGLPYDSKEDPAQWCHLRAHRTRKGEVYCPVCLRRGDLGLPVKPRTLCEVFGSSQQ